PPRASPLFPYTTLFRSLAADAKLSMGVATALVTLLGLHHGYLNGAGMGASAAAAVALLGLAFTVFVLVALGAAFVVRLRAEWARDRKSTRLNSSHEWIS